MSIIEQNFKFFVYYIFPVIIFFFGLTGNIFGFIVFFRKKVQKIGPTIIYRFLYLIDSVYLLFIITKYLQFGFNISFDDVSSTWCKTNRYFYYSLDAISPMLIVFISCDRYVAIKHKPSRKYLRQGLFQIGYFMLIFLFNAVYYSPIPVYQNLVDHSNGSTNDTSQIFCDFVSSNVQQILGWMDFVNLVAIPFLLMITFTFLIINVIFTSRRRVVVNYSNRENRIFQRDIKFAVTSIFLNLIYIVLQLPLAVINFNTDFNDYTFLLCVYIFFASYGTNFYIVFFSNSLFREEFFLLFKIKKLNYLNTALSNDVNNTNSTTTNKNKF